MVQPVVRCLVLDLLIRYLSGPYMFNSYPASKKKRDPWMYVTFGLAGLLILGLTGYFIATPFLTLNSLRNAAEARDGRTFAGYIDFPQFRENLKAELNAAMAQNLASDSGFKDNPFSGLGAMLAPTIINNMVDAYITPAGIERMMAAQTAPKDVGPQVAGIGQGQIFEGTAEMGYSGINEFQVAITDKDRRTTVLIFERQNIIGWRLINLKLPR